jgi:hypothetical protein
VAERAGATVSELVGSHAIYESQPAAVAADLIKQTRTESLSCGLPDFQVLGNGGQRMLMRSSSPPTDRGSYEAWCSTARDRQ